MPVGETPKGWTETTLELAFKGFRDIGFGPLRVGRYERSMREVMQYGPLGFAQRDIERITKAIGQATGGRGDILSQAENLAQQALTKPLEDVRRIRRRLQDMAKKAGAEFLY